MTFNECIDTLGIAYYPKYFPKLYEELCDNGKIDSTELTNRKYIRELNKKYSLFEHSEEVILKSASELEKDAACLRYLNLLSAATTDRERFKSTRLPELPSFGKENTGKHFAGLFAMLPCIRRMDKLMCKRGFDDEIKRTNFGSFEYCIDLHEARFGFPALSHGYFAWLQKYLDAIIIEYGGFRFEVQHLHSDIAVLKSKCGGDDVCLPSGVLMHREGMVLGSADYTDESGAFSAKLSEYENGFSGYPCQKNGFVSTRLTHFSKSEYELGLVRGDPVIDIHIPRGTNLRGTAFSDALSVAKELLLRYFPDFHPKAVTCTSWLLDPRLDEISGGAPNILNFQSNFLLFPVHDSGMDVFTFVFFKPYPSFEELPEDTRLMRGVKRRYLEGKHLHNFGGVFLL